MAATTGGHFNSASRDCLHLFCRHVARDTLPFAAGHFHPRIGPALVIIKRLSRRVGALAHEASRRDGCIAKHRYLSLIHIYC